MENNDDKPFFDSSRVEEYLNYIIGSSGTHPQGHPQSRLEAYLKYICEHPSEGMEDITLIYEPAHNTITKDGVEQTYEQIKTYVENSANYNVKMFVPFYSLMLYPTADDGGGMCEFTNIWLYEGEVVLVRVAINNNNNINYKEETVATMNYVTNSLPVQHIININAATNVGLYNCQVSFNAPKNKSFATTGDLANYLYSKKPNLRLPATGTYKENNVLYQVESIVASSSSQVSVEMYKISDGTEKTIQTGAVDIIDTIL